MLRVQVSSEVPWQVPRWFRNVPIIAAPGNDAPSLERVRGLSPAPSADGTSKIPEITEARVVVLHFEEIKIFLNQYLQWSPMWWILKFQAFFFLWLLWSCPFLGHHAPLSIATWCRWSCFTVKLKRRLASGTSPSDISRHQKWWIFPNFPSKSRDLWCSYM